MTLNYAAISRQSFAGTMYIVLEDFGALGQAFREADVEHSDVDAVVEDLIQGEFDHPLQVIAFNAQEGWARDVSCDIARRVIIEAQTNGSDLTDAVRQFADRALGCAQNFRLQASCRLHA